MESGYSICMNETTTVTDLSPSAQAVFDAAREASWDWANDASAHYSVSAVAVLRAAACQLANAVAAAQLRSIANELEAV